MGAMMREDESRACAANGSISTGCTEKATPFMWVIMGASNYAHHLDVQRHSRIGDSIKSGTAVSS